MAEDQQGVDDESEELVSGALVDAAAAESDDGGKGGGGGGTGESGSGAGSVGGSAAPNLGSAIRVGIASSGGPVVDVGDGGPSELEPDAAARPPDGLSPQPIFDPAAEAERVISEAASRLGMAAHILRMEYSPEGVSSAGVPMHIERRGFLGLSILVATDKDAARRLVPDLAPVSAVAGLHAGLTGSRVRPSQGRSGFVTLDGHDFAEQVGAGLRVSPVREERIPEGTLERRGMRPDNLSQAVSEFYKGFKAQDPRPKPVRGPVVVVVPEGAREEMQQALPDTTVVGFQPSVAGSLERATSTAIDAVVAFQADQEEQRAKLAAAFRRLWAERATLLAGGRVLSESQQARLGEVERRLTSLVNLARFGQLAETQLDSAEHSIHSASQDLESAVRAGAAGEVSASVGELEAVTADAELVGATTSEVADAAHVTVGQTDAQIAEWSQQQLESTEPPAELVAAVADGELPPGLSLSNADEVTGTVDLNVDQWVLDSVAPDAEPESPETASLETAATAEPSAASETSAEPEHAPIPAPVVTDPHDLEEPDLPGTPKFGDEPSIPDAPKIEPLAPSESKADAATTEDQPELAHSDDVPPLDGSAEPVPTPEAGADAASRQQHLAAESHAAGGELPEAHTVETADNGNLPLSGLGTPADASQTPTTPVARRSALTRVFTEDSDDDSGGGTAASMEKKDKDDTVAAGHTGEAAASVPDAAQVERNAQTHRRVVPSIGDGRYPADAELDPEHEEPARAEADDERVERSPVESPVEPEPMTARLAAVDSGAMPADPDIDSPDIDGLDSDDTAPAAEPQRAERVADAGLDSSANRVQGPSAEAADPHESDLTQPAVDDPAAPGDNDWVTPLPPAASVVGTDGAFHPDTATVGPAGSWQPFHATADLAQPPPASPEPGQSNPDVRLTSGITRVEVIPSTKPPVSPGHSRPSPQAATAGAASSSTTHTAPAPSR